MSTRSDAWSQANLLQCVSLQQHLLDDFYKAKEFNAKNSEITKEQLLPISPLTQIFRPCLPIGSEFFGFRASNSDLRLQLALTYHLHTGDTHD